MEYDCWKGWRGSSGFHPDLVADIIREGVKQQIQTAGIKGNKPSDVRRSKITWLNHLPHLRHELFAFVMEANRQSFACDVHNVADVQFTEYHASEKGHYDWHEDWVPFSTKPYHRKLSITVQLSDADEYEGGEFEINDVTLPDWIQEKGTVLIFPSFMKHRVKPVTKGVRRSLVAWFEGPRWR